MEVAVLELAASFSAFFKVGMKRLVGVFCWLLLRFRRGDLMRKRSWGASGEPGSRLALGCCEAAAVDRAEADDQGREGQEDGKAKPVLACIRAERKRRGRW